MRRPITSTYRLQLRGPKADPSGRAFGFAEAKQQVDYLASLGVSHLYLSPICTAMPTSNHGYDVVDPTEVNPELGGIEGLRELSAAAKDAGLGIIVDIVPNHMSVEVPKMNRWFWDVLTYGQDSEYESYFDIDWHHDNGAGGKLGMPVLGAEGDEDKIEIITDDDGDTVLAYYDNHYPIRPDTYHEGDTALEVYERQCYKLMYWRDGVISYRRFFSVNTLAGIRQEDPLVFEHTHRLLRQLIAEDLIDGVRVDHPDGLADPFAYLTRLRDLIGDDRWLVIEKILGVDEPLDPRLVVDGTTGYDALRELDGIFYNRSSEDSLSMLALQESGSTWDQRAFSATAQQLKAEIAATELAAEVSRLARAIRRDNFSTVGSEVSDKELVDTVIELIASMPVYRADYLSLSRVTATVMSTLARRYPSKRYALDLISAALLERSEASVRFAQVCGAVMAKGVEDTTFYRACRLVSLQEVGGAPGRYGVSQAEFHMLQHERAMLWPRTMTTLTTHDTKRSEDVRARIVELSERPDDFAELARRVTAQVPPPDASTGHFLFQNMLGVWPAGGNITDTLVERVQAYAEKAIREAGLHTAWTDQGERFESAICDWIESVMRGPMASAITEFVAELDKDAKTVIYGRKLLQLTGPGIPDTYQGQEYLDDSLVDPDNRRFVDYTSRRQSLSALEGITDFSTVTEPNWILQHITNQALTLRGDFPEIFVEGSYQAVFAEGPAAGHLVGFARGGGDIEVISVATRRPNGLTARGGWETASLTLPEGEWIDRLTLRRLSGKVQVADLFAIYPTALLVRAQ